MDDNLVFHPGVQISVSVPLPTGVGARLPNVLFNDTAVHLDGRPLIDFRRSRTFDTYDGQNLATQSDWYSIEFPKPTEINCVEMTMGIPYRDGGWWTTLAVEVQVVGEDKWQEVGQLRVFPPYPLEDTRGERRPFETYELIFDTVEAKTVRVIGQPGGVAQFTSLARLAVYARELTRWNPAFRPEPPVPYVFHLISPQTIWDLSKSFMKLTGLSIQFPFMEYYLDQTRAQQAWQWIHRNYEGEPELWFLIGDSIGWNLWNHQELWMETPRFLLSTEPRVYTWFHDALAMAVAPVVIDGTVMGEIATYPSLLKERLDWEWHKEIANRLGFAWSDYMAAVDRSILMTREQLEGAAELLAMIANQITGLAHRNRNLERELESRMPTYDRKAYRKQLVGRAIEFMQQQLELSIKVEDIARAVALSPAHFSVLFTEETGCNPGEYLILLRLERAKEFLLQDGLSVATVSDLLGYTPSYFCRLFKHRVGCTPGEYARRAQH